MAKVGRAARVASKQRVETISADKTIEAAETGELYLVNASSAGNFTITLPTAEEGAYFTILLSHTSNAAAEVLFDSGSGVKIYGNTIVQAAGGADTKAHHNNRKIGFGDSAKRGDIIELVSDGSDWYLLRAEASVAFVTAFS